jgi:hypothetical protein
LNELKELKNGDVVKDSIVPFMDEKFTRPMGITNEKINMLIEELEALSKLYE